MDALLKFAGEHVFLAWCALWLGWALFLIVIYVICIVRSMFIRVMRLFMVSLRGWPPAHLDADGDWMPEPESKEAQ